MAIKLRTKVAVFLAQAAEEDRPFLNCAPALQDMRSAPSTSPTPFRLTRGENIRCDAREKMSDRDNHGSRFSLGMGSSQRLRGGFRASMLPAGRRASGGRPSPPRVREQSDARVRDETTDSEESSGGSGSGSLVIICRNIHEQLGKVSRRIVVVEQQQKQISLALSSLIKRQEKASFSIKDSPLEVTRFSGDLSKCKCPYHIAGSFESRSGSTVLFITH